MHVLSKTCRICQYCAKSGKQVEHVCPKNYDGASKSMEVHAILDIVIDMYDNKNVTIGTIVSDDDSTMRARLQHSWAEKIKLGLMEKHD